MNKVELVAALAKETGFTKKDSATTLDAVVSVISRTLASGEEVRIVGFGTFRARECMPKKVRDFQTNSQIELPGTRRPVFLPGKALKDAVSAGFSDHV